MQERSFSKRLWKSLEDANLSVVAITVQDDMLGNTDGNISIVLEPGYTQDDLDTVTSVLDSFDYELKPLPDVDAFVMAITLDAAIPLEVKMQLSILETLLKRWLRVNPDMLPQVWTDTKIVFTWITPESASLIETHAANNGIHLV